MAGLPSQIAVGDIKCRLFDLPALRMHSLTVPQIRFIELIIDPLTAQGVTEAAWDGNSAAVPGRR